METVGVGELARRAGVGVETVRFYERRGLLAEPARRPSGYRRYGPDALARLRFVRRAKALGFTLAEVGGLLALRDDPAADRSELKRRAEAKVAAIDAKVRDLLRVRDALLPLAEACPGHGPLPGCPIFEALGREEAGGPPPAAAGSKRKNAAGRKSRAAGGGT